MLFNKLKNVAAKNKNLYCIRVLFYIKPKIQYSNREVH